MLGSVSSRKKILVGIDFDETLVNEKTEISVFQKLAQIVIKQNFVTKQFEITINQDFSNAQVEQNEMSKQFKGLIWPERSNVVFNYIHNVKSIPLDDILMELYKIEPVNCMDTLLRNLSKSDMFQIVVMSDCNSVFVNKWLEYYKLSDCVDDIICHPATVIDNKKINISPHEKSQPKTNCLFCKGIELGLCKATILNEYAKQNNYTKKVFIGDGNNDYCVAVSLLENDMICARKGYHLEKKLENSSARKEIKAEILIWESGLEIMEKLKLN